MHPFVDIVGDNAVHQITSGEACSFGASTIQIVVTGTDGTVVRMGGSPAAQQPSASFGIPIIANGGSQFLPWRGRDNLYQPGTFYVYVPAGATVSAAAIL